MRKFAAPAGPGPSLAPKQSCAAEAVSVGSNCGKVAYEAVRKQYNVVDIASCAAAVVAFGLCEFNGD